MTEAAGGSPPAGAASGLPNFVLLVLANLLGPRMREDDGLRTTKVDAPLAEAAGVSR